MQLNIPIPAVLIDVLCDELLFEATVLFTYVPRLHREASTLPSVYRNED